MTLSVIVLTMVASGLVQIVARETLGFVPTWMPVMRFLILMIAAIYYIFARNRPLAHYSILLTAMIGLGHTTAFIAGTDTWQGMFDMHTFTGHMGSMILLKFLGAVPLIGLLLHVLKSSRAAYLVAGDLSVKADPIRWLGIPPDSISWRRLSVLSAFAIAGGTLLLTLFTVTGFSIPDTFRDLPGYIPIILLLAAVNSLSEGFMFRNAVLGPLRHALPKDHAIWTSAVLFGIAHYYGAPSGVVGVVMSGVLGWYLARSMYETGGLLSSWIIHFMQDVVIFATLVLLGVFI